MSTQHGSMIGDDYQYDAFYIPAPAGPAVGTLPDPAVERIHALEKKVKGIEGNNISGSTSINMRLVSDLVIPDKFKTPEFEKYKGQTCPRSH